MDRLAEPDKDQRRMQELADSVHLSQSALSRLIGRLESEGLVPAAICSEDRRGIFACLTDAGRARYEAARPTQRARARRRARLVRALVQRVSEAAVEVDGGSSRASARACSCCSASHGGRRPRRPNGSRASCERLRVFDDAEGKMNLYVATSAARSCSCGSSRSTATHARATARARDAAPPGAGEPLYERVRAALGAQGGVFGARMRVSLVNDGPVTLLLEA